jgi:hypothetical protein
MVAYPVFKASPWVCSVLGLANDIAGVSSLIAVIVGALCPFLFAVLACGFGLDLDGAEGQRKTK